MHYIFHKLTKNIEYLKNLVNSKKERNINFHIAQLNTTWFMQSYLNSSDTCSRSESG